MAEKVTKEAEKEAELKIVEQRLENFKAEIRQRFDRYASNIIKGELIVGMTMEEADYALRFYYRMASIEVIALRLAFKVSATGNPVDEDMLRDVRISAMNDLMTGKKSLKTLYELESQYGENSVWSSGVAMEEIIEITGGKYGYLTFRNGKLYGIEGKKTRMDAMQELQYYGY